MMGNLPSMIYQKDKSRSYNNLIQKMDCKQSYVTIIGTKINCKTIKQQFCNEN